MYNRTISSWHYDMTCVLCINQLLQLPLQINYVSIITLPGNLPERPQIYSCNIARQKQTLSCKTNLQKFQDFNTILQWISLDVIL